MRRQPRARSLALILVALCPCCARSTRLAQTLEPIRYTVSFPAPHTHYLEIEASYPTEGRPSIELMMAVWTPGSYLIREYERHVEALTAADPGARAAGGRENAQEPLARHDERRQDRFGCAIASTRTK